MVFLALAGSAAVLAQVSWGRVAAVSISDVTNLMDEAEATHAAYLGARIALGDQLADLAAAMGPQAAARAARASLAHFQGLAFFIQRDADHRILWAAPTIPGDVELAAMLRELDASGERGEDGPPSVVADVGPWGRALVARIPFGGGDIVEAIQLAPLYEALYNKNFRSALDFSVHLGDELLYAHLDEPGYSRLRVSRSFPVLGRRWRMSLWIHPSLAAERRRRTWTRVFGVGLLAAAAASGVFGVVLARWLALGRARRHADELSRLTRHQFQVEEDQRRHIARELHDGIGQTLTALLIDVRRLLGSREVPKADLESIAEELENAVGSLRDIAYALRPPMLESLGLAKSLEWLARTVSRKGDLEVRVDASVTRPVPEPLDLCLYRIAQEAVSNTLRHAQARHLDLSLREEGGDLRLSIRDDGRGFDVAPNGPRAGRGLGLLGMRERATQLGGVVSVSSAPGSGTCIEVRLPRPPAATDASPS